MIGAAVASEWENILFSHHFIGVKVQALLRTFLNLLEHFISPKMVNYGYFMSTTYLSEQFLVMLLHFSKLKAIQFFSRPRDTLSSYIIVLYLWLNLSVLFA